MSAEAAKRMLENLKVSELDDRYRTMPPQTIGHLTQVGYYSMDEHFKFKPDHSELKYLHLPARMDDVWLNLNVAREGAISAPRIVHPNMDCVLRWLLLNKDQAPPRRQQFVCSRGVLSAVMHSPYDRFDGWIIRATRYKGNIYLCRLLTGKDIFEDLTQTENEMIWSNWGFKFEQYLTSDSPTSDPEDPTVPVNEIREFCCVVRTSVDDIPILVSGEMDALRSKCTLQQAQATGSPRCFVELKTTKIVNHPGQERTLKWKMVKWWSQSFIMGVPSIYCGFRDDDGIVRFIEEILTDDLPELCKDLWNPAVCLHFLKTFLELVSQYVVKDDHRVVYKFEWQPGRRITCRELPEPELYRFLPDWFISEM